MCHKESITSLCFSEDDMLLASGDKTGIIKIWKLETGKLLKKIENILTRSPSILKFGIEPSHLLAGSYETVKVIGLRSG
jgi:WD40 repeat protein